MTYGSMQAPRADRVEPAGATVDSLRERLGQPCEPAGQPVERRLQHWRKLRRHRGFPPVQGSTEHPHRRLTSFLLKMSPFRAIDYPAGLRSWPAVTERLMSSQLRYCWPAPRRDADGAGQGVIRRGNTSWDATSGRGGASRCGCPRSRRRKCRSWSRVPHGLCRRTRDRRGASRSPVSGAAGDCAASHMSSGAT